MTLGISFSLKSNLGVSPVSSIPYMITLATGTEMGRNTMLFQSGLVLLQILILRKRFRLINLSQIPVAVFFGLLTTFSNSLLAFMPVQENLMIRLFLLLLSIVLVAVGIFLYLPANLISMAPEGTVQAITVVTRKPLPTLKVAFDISLILIAGTGSFILLGGLGSIGIGTVVSALLVGTVLNFIMKRFRGRLDQFLYREKEKFTLDSEESAEALT